MAMVTHGLGRTGVRILGLSLVVTGYANVAIGDPATTPAEEWVFGKGNLQPGPAPSAGHYLLALQFHSHRFITMERDIAEGRTGRLELTLGPGGDVVVKGSGRKSSTYSVSHFASHDGQNHRDTSNDDLQGEENGTWKIANDAIELSFPGTRPWRARCVTLVPRPGTKVIPGPILACRLQDPPSWLQELAVAAQKEPHPGRAESETGPTPRWLLLGPAPGINLHWSEDRGEASVEITALNR